MDARGGQVPPLNLNKMDEKLRLQLLYKLKEDRKNYLDNAHTSEKEVLWTDGADFKEYFFLDGVKIWMPPHLKNVESYYKYYARYRKKSLQELSLTSE